MTTRTDQIASVLRRAVQSVLARGLNDPRIRGLISVTRVDVSPDLRTARVHVSIMPPEHETLTMHGLRNAAKYVQSEVSGAVRLRTLPRLEFVLDESLKKQAALEEAIRRGMRFDEDDGVQDDRSDTAAIGGDQES